MGLKGEADMVIYSIQTKGGGENKREVEGGATEITSETRERAGMQALLVRCERG